MANTQYRKNLVDLAQASKDYTDRKAEEILWQVGEYDITTQNDNTSALVKTAPTGATRCKIKRIYGNSVKYAPSSASDNTTANLKAIPENTYSANADIIGNTTTKTSPSTTSDDSVSKIKSIPLSTFTLGVDYVGGYTEKSENLIVLQDVSNTQQQVAYTLDSATGTITLNGTATGTFNTQSMSLTQTIPANTPLTLFMKGQSNAGIRLYFFNDSSYVEYFSLNATDRVVNFTKTSPINRIYVEIQSGAVFNNQTFQPMLVLGTYVSLDFKVGFTGLRSAKVSEIKASGNLMNVSIESGIFGSSGEKASNNRRIRTADKISLSVGTYTISFTGVNSVAIYIYDTNDVLKNTPSWQDTNEFTFTVNYDFKVNFAWRKTTDVVITPSDMTSCLLNKGSVVIPDITKQIPAEILANEYYGLGLSSSLYNSLNLISKKLNKKLGIVDLGSLTWNNYNSDTTGYSKYANAPSNMKVGSDSYVIKALTPNYEIVGFNSINQWTAKDKVLCGVDNVKRIIIRDTSDIKPSGYLVYELATEEDIDVSSYLDDSFKTLTTNDQYTNIEMVNEYDYDMPNMVEYYGKIDNDYADSVVFSGNLYNSATNTIGKAISSSGSIIDNANSYYSDYIDVLSSTAYYVNITNLATNSDFRVHYYNSSKQWLSATASANSTFTTPNNAVYVRLSVYNEADRVSNIILIKGSTAPSVFKPYVQPITMTIPSQIKALDGYDYGTTSTPNYIDFCNKKFNKVIGKVDLGSLTWQYNSANNVFYASISDKVVYSSANQNILCANYPNANTTLANMPDKTILETFIGNSRDVAIKDTLYNGDTTTFKTAMSGVYLYYELATPVQTDISSYLTDFNPIITNNNYTNYEVISHSGTALPNKISYFGTIKETLCTAINKNDVLAVSLTNNDAKYGWSAGSVYNTRDYTTNKGSQKVGRVDLGMLTITRNTQYDYPIFILSGITDIKQVGYTASNILNALYKEGTNGTGASAFANSTTNDLTIVQRVNTNDIMIKDLSCQTATALQTKINGVYLYYELATEVPENITPLDNNVIEVVEDDELEFVNSENQAVPSDITYRIEVAK